MRQAATRGLVVTLGVVVAAGLIASSYTVVDSHRQSNRSKKENRKAVILLARAICSQSAIIEETRLSRSTTRTERDVIREFFQRYNAQVNRALVTLGESGCDN